MSFSGVHGKYGINNSSPKPSGYKLENAWRSIWNRYFLLRIWPYRSSMGKPNPATKHTFRFTTRKLLVGMFAQIFRWGARLWYLPTRGRCSVEVCAGLNNPTVEYRQSFKLRSGLRVNG